MQTQRLRWLLGGVVLFVLLCCAEVAEAQSQPIPCGDVVDEYTSAVRKDRCLTVDEDTVCYGNYLVSCKPSD